MKTALKFSLCALSIATLAACGGSSNNGNTVRSAQDTETATDDYNITDDYPIQTNAPNVIELAEQGSIIVTESGLSLYVLANDTVGSSNCTTTASCTTFWPPLLAGDGAEATSDMTIIVRDDGTQQWAYRGQALYTFQSDSSQGDISGDAVDGIWHLARPMPIRITDVNGQSTLVSNYTTYSYTVAGDEQTQVRLAQDGFTLYTFDIDPIGESVCEGDCINAWPPILAEAGALASEPYSIIELNNGMNQWAYQGKALYLFIGDQQAGDTTGHRVNDIWTQAFENPEQAQEAPVVTETETDTEVEVGATTAFINEAYEDETVITVQGEVSVLINGQPELQDKTGFALYNYGLDGNGRSACTGDCAAAWPPLLATEDDVAQAPYSIIERAGGYMQWAYDGQPLYFFVTDTSAQDTTGENYLGVWSLLRP
ncbi:hypothetical protein HR060_10150 [Catenovulum sp. SM1970]|uniref:COG4315 family predicted lipoprotein n=1 Tax=Marinifaba aquimaris TaxID=2741323 RepID=UPI0015747ED2|nr:hypothetical protein [Marinifaba aquimaris]NTS77224.1 hypothetical protein [Marinifaba aquimaris]